ncbi:MAG: nucleotidyltransferase domain-containing protein [Bacteroidales bacterium]|nr:nucleotidyltransferase domain-containing protein [Bacteroidales bacterium]
MDKSEVIDKIKKYRLLLDMHFDIDSIFLFGSYAKDNFNKDSDIDVAIVVNELKGDYFSTTPILWKLRRQIDDRIEPILLERNFDKSGFLSEIQKSGIRID